MRRILSFFSLALAAALPAAALAAPLCPALSNASSAYYATDTVASGNCNTIITINPNGTLSVAYPNTNPYDGSEDNYVGVVNNTASSVGSIDLSSNTDIFGFDGDGIDAYGIAGNSADLTAYGSSAYGGPNAFFTNINNTATSGTVNFIAALAANGGTSYFSLESSCRWPCDHRHSEHLSDAGAQQPGSARHWRNDRRRHHSSALAELVVCWQPGGMLRKRGVPLVS